MLNIKRINWIDALFIGLVPILSVGAFLYCSYFESSCETKKEHAEQAKSEKYVPTLNIKWLGLTYKNESGATEEKAAGRKDFPICSTPCELFQHTLEDPVALFTLLLFYAVCLQLVWMNRQERVLKETVFATNTSVNIAQREFDAAHRPWLKVSVDIASDLTWDINGGALMFMFNVNNIGTTPAINVSTDLRIYVPWGEQIDSGAMQIKMFEPIRLKEWTGRHFGYTVFPGDTISLPVGSSISREDINKFLEIMNAVRGEGGVEWKFFPIAVAGFIGYNSSFNKTNLATGFGFDIRLLVDGRVTNQFEVDKAQPRPNLVLVHSVIGGGIIA